MSLFRSCSWSPPAPGDGDWLQIGAPHRPPALPPWEGLLGVQLLCLLPTGQHCVLPPGSTLVAPHPTDLKGPSGWHGGGVRSPERRVGEYRPGLCQETGKKDTTGCVRLSGIFFCVSTGVSGAGAQVGRWTVPQPRQGGP